MLGAIIGDIAGSIYEFNATKRKDVPILTEESYFTDDTVCTCAVAEAILDNKPFGPVLADWVQDNLDNRRGYGPHFLQWALKPDRVPYNSWGNGAAMRVSPAAWLADDLAHCWRIAGDSAAVSHDHAEGMRGARATAVAVRLMLEGGSKDQLRDVVTAKFGYDLDRRLDDIRPTYDFRVSCQHSAPESLICFLEADSYEDAIRNAISLGGDADTMAAIAGSVAEAHFGIPDRLRRQADRFLTKQVKGTLDRFTKAVEAKSFSPSDPTDIPIWMPPAKPAPRLDDQVQQDLYEQEMAKIDKLLAATPPGAAKQPSLLQRLWRLVRK